MFKYKQGFTLAEVLITVGIIGVAAAIVIPALTSNTIKATIGSQLSREVQVVEQGIGELFAAAQRVSADNGVNGANAVNSISALQLSDVLPDSPFGQTYLTNGNTLFQSAGVFLDSKQIQEADRTSYMGDIKTYDGSAMTTLYEGFSENLIFRIKKLKGYVIPESMSDNTVISYINSNGLNDVPGDVVIDRVFIDANGPNQPNRLGLDVFMFGLTNAGRLVPAGSGAYNNNIFNEEIPLYTEACVDAAVTDARSCAAKVVANGWKVD